MPTSPLTSIKVFRSSDNILICETDEAEVVATITDDDFFRLQLKNVVWDIKAKDDPKKEERWVHPSVYLKGAPFGNERFIIRGKEGRNSFEKGDMQMFMVRGVDPTREEEDANIFKYDLVFQSDRPARMVHASSKAIHSLKKPIGRSLHIGIDQVDPKHYGDTFPLGAGFSDAVTWIAIDAIYQYEKSKMLLQSKVNPDNVKATRSNVKNYIENVAKELKAGDTFLVTYSGHGARIKPADYLDTFGLEEEGYYNAWCLYDGLLFDAELLGLWSMFKPGVNIIIVADCCHSGGFSIFSLPENFYHLKIQIESQRKIKLQGRYLKDSSLKKVVTDNIEFYKEIIGGFEPREKLNARVKASGILLAACAENEVSRELVKYDNNLKVIDAGGALSIAVRQTLLSRKKQDNYLDFLTEIKKLVAIAGQTPQLSTFGVEDSNVYLKTPFTI